MKILFMSRLNPYDINEWSGIKWEPRKDITFTHYDKLSSIKDKSIDLITVFHSLHHIKENEYNYILENFNRILSNDGVIVEPHASQCPKIFADSQSPSVIVEVTKI